MLYHGHCSQLSPAHYEIPPSAAFVVPIFASPLRPFERRTRYGYCLASRASTVNDHGDLIEDSIAPALEVLAFSCAVVASDAAEDGGDAHSAAAAVAEFRREAISTELR